MWNHETDKMFLELRDDAVMLFERDSKKLIYLNHTAKKLFPHTDENTSYSSLIQNEEIDRLCEISLATGRLCGRSVEEAPWFPESAFVHTFVSEWEGVPVLIVTIDRRNYGAPPEALQMMKAVLDYSYFYAVRIDIRIGRASIIIDENPLMNMQATFPSYTEYIKRYAEAIIHPEDRPQFLSTFSIEQLRLFTEANTEPSCTVRRLCDEEYRWASFTLTMVGPGIVLMFGKDSNERHLMQERSEHYRSEMETFSQRNSYIISGVSDIFRLMLHIDLRTGETMILTLQPDLNTWFSYEQTYAFDDVAKVLIQLVHPEDRPQLEKLTDLQTLPTLVDPVEKKLNFEYRRVAPEQDPDINAKWTRSTFTLTAFEDDVPTEAVYAVQDIDIQKRREIEAKRAQESLNAQFYTLIRNRFIWFINNDFEKQVSLCYRIANHTVMPPMECPFGQFFERMIMPHCHPEDYMRVSKALLPLTAETNYEQGKRQITVDYRHKSESGWRYARAEVYLQRNEQNQMHTLIYISDIDDEVNSRDKLTRAEHEQLELHRRVDSLLTESCIHVGEIDLDADTVRHYRMENNELVPIQETICFSKYCADFASRYVHPEQQTEFRRIFSYDEILRTARELDAEIRHLFLLDLSEKGQFVWCNIILKVTQNEHGKRIVMTYIENLNAVMRMHDDSIHSLHQEKEHLQENIRINERSRIRSAHIFMNIASSFQLALNQIYGALDSLERALPPESRSHAEVRSVFTAYEHLSAMTECAKDLLLLENNQLPILQERISLPKLFRNLRLGKGRIFDDKQIRLVSYSTGVTDETVLCDSRRLTFLFENIFFNVLRSLPDHSEVTARLSESPASKNADSAVYEFSLMTRGDSVAQDIQRSILSPIPTNDPLSSVEPGMYLRNADFQQHNLYFSKRLIAAMGGTLDFIPLPDHAGAVVLRLPLKTVPQQIIFPLRKTFGKRALVWDSKQPAALATMEILRESGMQSEWAKDYESAKAYLIMAQKQENPYDIVVLRQQDINNSGNGSLSAICDAAGNAPVVVIADQPANAGNQPAEQPNARLLPPPIFRSTVAEVLQELFGGED